MSRCAALSAILTALALAMSPVSAQAQSQAPQLAETATGTRNALSPAEQGTAPQIGALSVIERGSYALQEDATALPGSGGVRTFGSGLLADYYPFGSGFRLSGGAFTSGYDAAMPQPGPASGTAADPGVSLSDGGAVVPALAVGYGSRLGGGLRISGDLGAFFPGTGPFDAGDPGLASPGQAGIIPYASLSIGMSF